MELNWMIIVVLLEWFPIGCSRLDVFCKLPYCGINNLACNNNAKYEAMCPPNARIISMGKYRKSLLNAFNEFRNSTASGKQKYLKAAAARMSRLSNSMDLEKLSRMAIKTCSPNKLCLSSPEFYYVGTNLGSTYHDRLNKFEDLELMLWTIHDWTTYADNVDMKMVIYMPPFLEEIGTAKALLLMADRNTHVGCSAMRFTGNHSVHHFIFMCAFSTDIFVKRPIYRMTSKPGTACKRLDPTYSALCAVGENYNNNKPVPNAMVYGHTDLALNVAMEEEEQQYMEQKE
ncbi:allergen Tab y 5.0101 [Drosophila eugracilis]|uniref:allergen Tab y 5.0101 n=1 Tax=Drosophila eugracilis TaxID=29029 RepID=UPI001BD9BB89|nr:allergen Tab y 5.0101 [Drosophila eugracilis]